MSANFSWVWNKKILDTCYLSWRRKMWNKNIQRTLKHQGLCYVPLPSFIFISSFIQCLYVFMLKWCTQSSFIHHSSHPLCLLIYWNIGICVSRVHLLNNLLIMWLPLTLPAIVSLFAHFHSWLRCLLVIFNAYCVCNKLKWVFVVRLLIVAISSVKLIIFFPL